MINKTSALVQAGILAAVAVIMALIALYVPVIGVFVVFLWPIPIIACGYKHGLKYSLMTLVIASIIIAMLVSPVNAFFLGVIFGTIGLVLGESMHRKLKPFYVLLYGSIGAFVALIINLVLCFYLLGINPLTMLFASMDESLVHVEAFYRSMNFSEEETQKFVGGLKNMISMMRVIMPGAFLTFAPIIAFVDYWVAKKLLTRLGESFESLPPFSMLKVPNWVLVPYILSLIGVTYFYTQNMQEHWGYKVSVNIQTVCCLVLVLQALSLLYWYVEVNKKPRWWAEIGIALLFIVPIFSQFAVYMGAFDLVFDYRDIRGYNYKQKLIEKENSAKNKKNKKR